MVVSKRIPSGNVRLSYTDADPDPEVETLEIIEENNYYPYGLKMRGFNELNSALGNSVAERWKFGGKEFDFDLNTYDFGARNYDPVLGRWMNIDPLAEVFFELTPFRYAFNNPVNVIDKDGNIEWPLKVTYVVQKNVSEYIKNQKVWSRGRGWIVQTGYFESVAITDEYKRYVNNPDQNAIIRTSQWNILRKSTPTRRMTSPHIGTDFRAQVGTNIYSLGDGKITNIDRKAGNLTVEYGDGDLITFRHLNSIGDFEEGQTIYEGQIIAQSGKRRTRVPHLHVDAVDKNGNQINVESKNYGSVTNKEFFTWFNGDFEMLKIYNDAVKNGEVTTFTKDKIGNKNWQSLTEYLQELINNDNNND